MTTNDKEYNYNAETGEVVIRELTNQEQILQDAVINEKIAVKESKAAAKAAAQAKLAALGLTVEDLQALGL